MSPVSDDTLRLIAIAIGAALVKCVSSIDRDTDHMTVVAGKLVEELRVRGLAIVEVNRPGAC